MACAKRHDVCIIPFGGGTSVTQVNSLFFFKKNLKNLKNLKN